MSKVATGIKYWMQIFLLPIYLLSFLIPRNKKIWIYGSTFGRRFADNPKYFFLYMNQNYHKEIRSIWITRDKNIVENLTRSGYEAYYVHSLKGMYFALIGGVYLFDNYSKDISFWLSGRSIKINLWHGIPLKKINMDNIYDKVRHPENNILKLKYALRRLSDEKPSHYVLCTSSFLSNIFASAFGTQKVLVAGYPRNDILVSDQIKDVVSNNDIWIHWMRKKKEEGKNIITYMPTFRESESMLFEIVNFKNLDDFLFKNSLVLCVKVHPKSKINQELIQMEGNDTLSSIKIIDANMDPYQIIKRSDQLITDYSSIYFDYLLLNKPIIFFPYDFELYTKNSRELYFEYNSVTPGPKVYTMEELEKALLNKDDYIKERENIKSQVFEHSDSIASELLYKQIKDIIKG